MKFTHKLTLLLLFIFVPLFAMAQGFLEKPISINVKQKPLSEVLNEIGTQGNFYFSYNSSLINSDSLISLRVNNLPLRQILKLLFDRQFEYTETKTHVIIQVPPGTYWYASGYVKDELTGEGIAYASVYEKTQFVSTLTNELGYFRLRLRDRNKSAVLSVSKSWYTDTAIIIGPDQKQELHVDIKPKSIELDSFVLTQRKEVESRWLSNLLLSSRQRIQSVNLGKFFADKPYQTSLIPGMGTHGRLSSQSVNKFSFNLLGGYTGGVNGFELGGAFNINKANVEGVQIGGIFNMTAGSLHGVQVAGAFNNTLKSSSGSQFAGITNLVHQDIRGTQIAGAYNHIWGELKGVQVSGIANMVKTGIEGAQISGGINYSNNTLKGSQIAGIANLSKGKTEGTQIGGGWNYANDSVKGTQIAGFANITRKVMQGTQISCFVNYAKHVKGVQIGIINIADTSSGASFGLINIIRKGYHTLSISSNEITNLQVSTRLGNHNVYTIFSFSMNVGAQKAFTGGYGIGRKIQLNKHLFLSPEISMHQLYLGDFDFVNGIFRMDIGLNYKINSYLSVFVAPSYSYCYKDQTHIPSGYRTDLPYNGLISRQHSQYWSSWMGWNVGINLF